jgi:hypothetical protein
MAALSVWAFLFGPFCFGLFYRAELAVSFIQHVQQAV